MKKFDIPHVAMAVLLLDDDDGLHSDSIARRIIDSDLTELGYKGQTPERTVNSQLRNSSAYSKYFAQGKYRSYFRLADRNQAVLIPEVRCALFALKHQQGAYALEASKTVEVTFHEENLVGVRNVECLRTADSFQTTRVQIPREPSVEEAGYWLPKAAPAAQ